MIVKQLLFLLILMTVAQAHVYECRNTNHHRIHIVTLDPQGYEIDFVKAHNSVLGRETVAAMALRSKAMIAINGGFFEIGNGQDGMPSGTLVINDQVIGLRSVEHACLMLEKNQLSIKLLSNNLRILIENKPLSLRKVNQFATKGDVILYTSAWGKNTLTPFIDRQEVTIDTLGNILAIAAHGNSAIPENGLVISFPSTFNLSSLAIGGKLTIDFSQSLLREKSGLSALMGIPMLIANGKINPEIGKSQSSFYTLPHARTAIGLKPNGDIILIVAEHAYSRPLEEITLAEVKTFLQTNKTTLTENYKKSPQNLTLAELKTAIQKGFSAPDGAVGLSIQELAHLMLELGCSDALNLDGGGSASLWLFDHIVTTSIGDQDEAIGQSILRPVSDAIVFKKKHS